MSRILLLAVGSRGDVQPYLALARHLDGLGYQTTLATHRPFQDLVQSNEVSFSALPGDPREEMLSDAGQELLATGMGQAKLARRFARVLTPWFERLVEVATPLSGEADLIVYSPLAFVGWHLGQWRRIPSVLAVAQPFGRTRAFPVVTAGGADRGPWINLWSHVVVEQVAWQSVRKVVDRWRVDELGLGRLGFRGAHPVLERTAHPRLLAYSPAVVPPPPDWGPEFHVTGYWQLPATPLPPVVESFLDAGPSPIYIGFGSMSLGSATDLSRIVVEAARAAGSRVILGTGWAGLGAGGDDVLAVDEVSHRSLFPRLAGVVHHGGAGTTGVGFTVGVPQLVVPFFADQGFWGDRVHVLGCGPEPLRIGELASRTFAARVEQLIGDPALVERAREVADHVAAEDGLQAAARLIESLLSRTLPD